MHRAVGVGKATPSVQLPVQQAVVDSAAVCADGADLGNNGCWISQTDSISYVDHRCSASDWLI